MLGKHEQDGEQEETRPLQKKRKVDDISETSSEGEVSTMISSDNIDFMLNINVVGSGKNLYVKVSTNRLKTKNGKIQGSHVTAFRTFFSLLASCIGNKEPEAGVEYLYNVAKSYLPTEIIGTLDRIKWKHEQEFPKVMLRKERKDFTNLLRAKGISEEEIEKVKYALKYTLTSKLADYMQEVATCIIQKTNQLENMTFARDRIRQVKESEEGFKIKMAIKCLVSIDKLASIEADDTEELNDLITEKYDNEHYYFNGIKNFFEEYNKEEHKRQFLVKPENNTINLSEIVTKLNVLNTVGQEKINVNHFLDTFAKYMEDLYDYRAAPYLDEGEEIIPGGDVAILCESSARHIVILFHSFRNIIDKLSVENRRELCKRFMSKVFDFQRWSDQSYESEEGYELFTIEKYHDKVFAYLSDDMLSMTEFILPTVEDKRENYVL